MTFFGRFEALDNSGYPLLRFISVYNLNNTIQLEHAFIAKEDIKTDAPDLQEGDFIRFRASVIKTETGTTLWQLLRQII